MEEDPVFETKQIDPRQRRRRIWVIAIAALVVAILFFGSQILSVYVDALWFNAVGYSSVYWYKFKLGGALIVVFFLASFLILRVGFWVLASVFPQLKRRPKLKLTSVEDVRDINFLPYVYRPGAWIVSLGIALLFSVGMGQSWADFALYLHSSPAGVLDPIFHRDVTFFLFTLPVLEEVSSWFLTIAVILAIGVGGAAGYMWYFDRVKGFGSTETARKATAVISAVTAIFALALAFNTYLSRYDLLANVHDAFSGISYTDDHVQLPGLAAVVVVLLIAAIVLAINAVVAKRIRVIGWMAAAVVVVWVLGTLAIPQAVFSFSVKPNELAKEAPYIDHNIQMTRHAFGLDGFEERPFTPAPTILPADLEQDKNTVDNIRLWDPAVLQATLSQVQEIRQYYDFGVPDIDRYVINGKLRQVMLAARELNVEKLAPEARNWINQHLIYTHGYGVTMSTVNEFTHEGLPNLVLKDMPVHSEAPEIKVTRPEIYFGEETSSHVYVHTRPQSKTAPEFNYPAAGNVDSYTEYESNNGIQVGGMLRKIALSLYLGDGSNLLFSDFISSNSRLLIHRAVGDRVREIAPFLTFDDDPYIVINKDGRLFWIIDGYTTSGRYPYSAAAVLSGGQGVNYIRNSVKAVVDAYQGTVSFYVFQPDDPIIKAYESIFPVLFHPASEMPADLRAHVRYPNLLVQVQAQAFTQYHVTNSQTFYNHEDVWAVATVETPAAAGGQATAPDLMRPYYVLMQLPNEADKHTEFVNILPFTPAGKDRYNMIGWMAGRSDGQVYGHTLVYTFPKNVTVNGPAQVRARVNQDPTLSAEMTLWNQNGSKLRRGNLLVIPAANSLLYVEPFFLQAENSPLPELRQVAIATQDRLAAGGTFDDAIAKLFPGFEGLGISQSTAPPGGTPGSPQMGLQPASGTQSPAAAGQPAQQPNPSVNPGAAGQPGQPSPELSGLAAQARQLLADYGKLAAEGKYKEAGDKLDQLKEILDQIARKSGGK
ncbi:MAG TPA: UPF0182 family protein [Blastocatellia bacterium]|nr:UPF0182 family protein [Blastocatellia bacterium]